MERTAHKCVSVMGVVCVTQSMAVDVMRGGLALAVPQMLMSVCTMGHVQLGSCVGTQMGHSLATVH